MLVGINMYLEKKNTLAVVKVKLILYLLEYVSRSNIEEMNLIFIENFQYLLVHIFPLDFKQAWDFLCNYLIVRIIYSQKFGFVNLVQEVCE